MKTWLAAFTALMNTLATYLNIRSRLLEYELDARVEFDIADLRKRIAKLRESDSVEDKHTADELQELFELRIKARNRHKLNS